MQINKNWNENALNVLSVPLIHLEFRWSMYWMHKYKLYIVFFFFLFTYVYVTISVWFICNLLLNGTCNKTAWHKFQDILNHFAYETRKKYTPTHSKCMLPIFSVFNAYRRTSELLNKFVGGFVVFYMFFFYFSSIKYTFYCRYNPFFCNDKYVDWMSQTPKILDRQFMELKTSIYVKRADIYMLSELHQCSVTL